MEKTDVTRVCRVCGKELDIDLFHKTAWGFTHVCKECVKNKRLTKKNDKANLENAVQLIHDARQARLESFPDDELLAEVSRRGYDGVITKSVVVTKDLSKYRQE